MLWFTLGALVLAGLAAWGWAHYKQETVEALDKAGETVTKIEDKLK
jgi:hypothetical protein